jgi:hypothetical protein
MTLNKQTLLAIVGTSLVAMCCAAQARPNHPVRKFPTLYELYSWQDGRSGIWNYSLLPSPSGVYTPAAAIFSSKVKRVDALTRQVSKLPIGARIYWFDRILPETAENAKQSQRLGYPPQAVVDKLQRYAKTRKIEVEIHSASPVSR